MQKLAGESKACQLDAGSWYYLLVPLKLIPAWCFCPVLLLCSALEGQEGLREVHQLSVTDHGLSSCGRYQEMCLLG